jgi:hypothetical protein
MNVTLRMRPLLTLSLPPPLASITCWLIVRHLAPGTIWPLAFAGLGGLLCLAAILIMEHEETRRAALPYQAELILAKAEARNRGRYAKAQTRRWARLGSGDQYSPDKATDLTVIVRGIREHTAGDSSATRRSA